ncbi:hypothetical protein [Nocardia sp. NPDC005366]|uniref:hypothetical protein n=1 Tax=Nocardia sp. NPDC005366 TaxID=3156878 RepID=UPI0033A5B491
MTGEQAITSAAAVVAFSAGAARGHAAAVVELAELYGYLRAVSPPVVGVRVGVR